MMTAWPLAVIQFKYFRTGNRIEELYDKRIARSPEDTREAVVKLFTR